MAEGRHRRRQLFFGLGEASSVERGFDPWHDVSQGLLEMDLGRALLEPGRQPAVPPLDFRLARGEVAGGVEHFERRFRQAALGQVVGFAHQLRGLVCRGGGLRLSLGEA